MSHKNKLQLTRFVNKQMNTLESTNTLMGDPLRTICAGESTDTHCQPLLAQFVTKLSIYKQFQLNILT